MAEAINVVIGNHLQTYGIGEVLYTLRAFLSRISHRYEVTFSIDLEPSKINVLIDEFAVPGTVAYLRKFKQTNPGTKLIVIATEFITPIDLFGMRLGQTFNYFDHWEDRQYGAEMIAHQLGLTKMAPYMRARYLGFFEMLRVADLVVAVHPAIVAALTPLAAEMDQWVAAPASLYPEIDAEPEVLKSRLVQWPVGFVMTGTFTNYRRRIAKSLIRSSRIAGVQGPVFTHLPFDRTSGFDLYDGVVEFSFEKPGPKADDNKGIEKVGGQTKKYASGALFNLNPPQRAKWPYSSPMRILRAVLYGQIPVVTRHFGDHEIEAIAKVLDPEAKNVSEFCELWIRATLGGENLIEDHIAAVAKYNRIAEQKNAAVELALQAL